MVGSGALKTIIYNASVYIALLKCSGSCAFFMFYVVQLY